MADYSRPALRLCVDPREGEDAGWSGSNRRQGEVHPQGDALAHEATAPEAGEEHDAMTTERWIQFAKLALGAGAVAASFLLVQSDVVVAPVVKVALGVYLAVAAYLNPESLVRR